MEASSRFLASRNLLLPKQRPLHFSSLSPLLRNPNPRNAARFTSSFSRHFPKPSKPFLSLSAPRISASSLSSSPSDHKSPDIGGDLGFGGEKGPIYTVVFLGWLGAKEKHLKRYEELYSSRAFRMVRFVVPVRETIGFDLCRRVEGRIGVLAADIVSWCSESEVDGKERHLIFHTFSNTGWLIYGSLLQNLQSKNDITKKIKGCVFDSAPSSETSAQVWAAGYCAALLNKHKSSFVETVDGGNKLNAQKITSALIEMITMKLLEMVFTLFLMLPYVNQRLRSVISTLKDQPLCPQLYLYSSADKVIPAHAVENFIEEQKSLGKNVHAHDFGLSPHVDHFRRFPHIYSSKVNEFLKHCCMPMVHKR